MSLTYAKLFEPVQLPNSAATIYTAPVAPPTTLLRAGRIRLVNTTAGAVAANVNVVPAGDSAGDENSIWKDKTVPANDYVDIDLPTMKAGDFISAFAGAADSITMHLVTGVLFA